MSVISPLSWVGSKTSTFTKISKYIPTTSTKYVEPFVGGGAFLFNILALCDSGELNFKHFTISDANPILIAFFNNLRNNMFALLLHLKRIEKEFNDLTLIQQSQYYYSARNKFNNVKGGKPTAITTSAIFMFLNKTAFGGLYRENSDGNFNVAFGGQHRKLKRHLDLCSQIAAASSLLQKYNIKFYVRNALNMLLSSVDSNTFVYLDPPYTIGQHNTFTSYLATKFTDDKQIQLLSLIDAIHAKGACVLMSNSNTEWLKKTAKTKGFDKKIIKTKRTISDKDSSELLLGFFKNCRG